MFEWAKKDVGAKAIFVDMCEEHFLEAFTRASKTTLHVDIFSGGDFHHTCEAVFKALGRALREAVEQDPRVKGIPSTKGKL